ncbi:hypothetical protein [Devosia sp. A369]
MATQKELVAVVAKEMGVSLETVIVIDRLLAAAGLRTRALRGRGNTPMTYLDAANLIIATALDVSPRNAVDLVTSYGALPATRVKEDARIADDALGATFGEALAAVVESIPEERGAFSAPDDAPGAMSMTVFLHGPDPRAEILLIKSGIRTTFQYGPSFAKHGDLKRTVQFTQITLGVVGESVAEGFAK